MDEDRRLAEEFFAEAAKTRDEVRLVRAGMVYGILVQSMRSGLAPVGLALRSWIMPHVQKLCGRYQADLQLKPSADGLGHEVVDWAKPPVPPQAQTKPQLVCPACGRPLTAGVPGQLCSECVATRHDDEVF